MGCRPGLVKDYTALTMYFLFCCLFMSLVVFQVPTPIVAHLFAATGGSTVKGRGGRGGGLAPPLESFSFQVPLCPV